MLVVKFNKKKKKKDQNYELIHICAYINIYYYSLNY